ncbi:MAG: hypothetical protein JF632_02710 [Acidobacteria bacterium]|jgi:hypothetical protein|nr:hypothetical protein [Acidobacteriota bacterium]
MFLRVQVVAALFMLSIGSWQSGSSTQSSNNGKEEFSAIAVNMAPGTTASSTPVEITIERWTSDAERDRLMTVLKEKGPDELLKVLQKEPKVGSIRTRESLAYDLRYARQLPGQDGGRRIVLGTDRPIGFLEAQEGGQTLDYRFTLIELRVGPDGKGEGKLSIAARPEFNDHVLVIEDYAAEPVRLQNVEKR